ncbi:hypothetical protein BDZ91DRAFT_223688 [Kalaharituber pfeilii]|nr:hypothetical protein BDZ91DRAFT_223688 [Kalaharituber pfeilii]
MESLKTFCFFGFSGQDLFSFFFFLFFFFHNLYNLLDFCKKLFFFFSSDTVS